MATVAATPKLQTSRKGKKAWRKNVDITDVTTGLEQVRQEIIQGGIITEKPDTSLFTIDTTGSLSISKKIKATSKTLKVDEILNARSAIPALIHHKKRDITSAVGDGILPESKKHRKNGVSHKDLERLRRIAYGGEDAKDAVKTTGGIKELYDPWGDAVPDTRSAVEKGLDNLTFVEKPKKPVAPSTLKRAPVGLVGAEGEILPAVKVPNPGISYNPEFDKWDDLITQEGDKEIKEELKRMKQAEYQRMILEKAAEETDEEFDSEEDESSEDEEDNDALPKKTPQRKTPSQRNKVKRRKEAERQLRHQSNTEVRQEQLDLIKKLKANGDLQLQKGGVVKRKALTPGKRLVRRRKFDKDVLPQAPLELQLPDELADSLRRLKPEGNLLRDRFTSLRERGIVETRLFQQQKKGKKKLTEKWSYKDWKP